MVDLEDRYRRLGAGAALTYISGLTKFPPDQERGQYGRALLIRYDETSGWYLQSSLTRRARS